MRKRRLPETRERIIQAAEQLFARHGIAVVSLQQIVAAADHRNTSAVQYHFGSKQALIKAIFSYRQQRLDAQRLALVAEMTRRGRAHELRPLVEAIVYPLAQSVRPGSTFVRFVAQAMYDPVQRYIRRKDLGDLDAIRAIETRILAALHDLPLRVRHQRFRLAWRLAVQALAIHERDLDSRQRPLMSTQALAADLVESILGLLRAPLPRRSGDGRASPP
jgi:AcrR family transcriptional regulator